MALAVHRGDAGGADERGESVIAWTFRTRPQYSGDALGAQIAPCVLALLAALLSESAVWRCVAAFAAAALAMYQFATLPRYYEIAGGDRPELRIKVPLALLRLSFARLGYARPATLVDWVLFVGFRAAAASVHLVEVTQRRGVNVLIAPRDLDGFLLAFARAAAEARAQSVGMRVIDGRGLRVT